MQIFEEMICRDRTSISIAETSTKGTFHLLANDRPSSVETILKKFDENQSNEYHSYLSVFRSILFPTSIIGILLQTKINGFFYSNSSYRIFVLVERSFSRIIETISKLKTQLMKILLTIE